MLVWFLAGCAGLQGGGGPPGEDIFVAAPANTGVEKYSAWFGDSDGRVLYFGLSPFWTLWWAGEGNPHLDLAEPGDHLIGRFDMQEERFLDPLLVRAKTPEALSSVWDVMVHSNGRVYFTTYFEEFGWVDPRTGTVKVFEGLGTGMNELVEGPNGHVYVTRYSDVPADAEKQTFGSLLVLSEEGVELKEFRFARGNEGFTAPKSVAVDPLNGDIWMNADVFRPGGRITHRTLRLSRDGAILEKSDEGPELLFMRFDPRGRGFFIEDHGGELRLVVRERGEFLAWLPLGKRTPGDFAQDIHFAEDGRAAVSFWSGRVVVLAEREGQLAYTQVTLPRPRECTPPDGQSVFYSAVIHGPWVYGTLHCGPAVTRVRIPD